MKPGRLKPHARWIALLAAALVLLLAGLPLARRGGAAAADRAKILAAERAMLEEADRRFDEDMRLAERQDGSPGAEDIDRLLAPVDRLGAASVLERQAAAARLTHFVYTLAPEKKAVADSAAGLAESKVTLAADMPLDTDAHDFIDRLSASLPGRVRLRRFSLTRLAADAFPSTANVHMEAEAEWLSNGAAGNGGGAP
jgi:hypothetical protein